MNYKKHKYPSGLAWDGIAELQRQRDDLLMIVEGLAKIEATDGYEGYCVICFEDTEKHSAECLISQARAAIARREGGGK